MSLKSVIFIYSIIKNCLNVNYQFLTDTFDIISIYNTYNFLNIIYSNKKMLLI